VFASSHAAWAATRRSVLDTRLVERRWWGRFVNIWAIVATKFGGATSLGLGALQIASGIALFTGQGASKNVAFVIILVLVTFAILSALSGVARGIKWLSNANMVLAVVLVLFVLNGTDIVGSGSEEQQFFTLLQNYPAYTATGILVMILVAIFWVSGADASAVVLATLSSRDAKEPNKFLHRSLGRTQRRGGRRPALRRRAERATDVHGHRGGAVRRRDGRDVFRADGRSATRPAAGAQARTGQRTRVRRGTGRSRLAGRADGSRRP